MFKNERTLGKIEQALGRAAKTREIDALPGRQYRFPKSMSSVLAGMVLQIDSDSGEADFVLGTAVERNV